MEDFQRITHHETDYSGTEERRKRKIKEKARGGGGGRGGGNVRM